MANFATGLPVKLTSFAEFRCADGRKHDGWTVDMPHQMLGSRTISITTVLSNPIQRVHIAVDIFNDLLDGPDKDKIIREFRLESI